MPRSTLHALLLSALCLTLFGLTGGDRTAEAASAPSPRELVLLNWSEYMDPSLIEEFETRFGAEVTEVYYESDEMRDDMLLETGGRGYDVIVVGGAYLRGYRKRGWVAPLDASLVPNAAHIEPRWLDLFPDARGYALPHFWGTTGIGYRKDLVPEGIDSWMQLYRPAPSLHGKIYMTKTSRDVIGMALKALGYSANSGDTKEIDAAEALVLAQKPFVKAYDYPFLDEKSVLVSGDVHAAMMFNGDVLALQAHHPEIAYVLPKEGGNLWVDYLMVASSSERKALAYAFIDYLNEPENAARLARFVHFASPNKAAEALLPPEFLADPVIYPSPEALAQSEVYGPLPPRVTKRNNLIFARLLQ